MHPSVFSVLLGNREEARWLPAGPAAAADRSPSTDESQTTPLGLRDLIPCDIATGGTGEEGAGRKERMPCAQLSSELNIWMNACAVYLRICHRVGLISHRIASALGGGECL